MEVGLSMEKDGKVRKRRGSGNGLTNSKDAGKLHMEAHFINFLHVDTQRHRCEFN